MTYSSFTDQKLSYVFTNSWSPSSFARFAFIRGLFPDLTNKCPYLSAIPTSIQSILKTHIPSAWQSRTQPKCIHHCLWFTPITVRNNNIDSCSLFLSLIYTNFLVQFHEYSLLNVSSSVGSCLAPSFTQLKCRTAWCFPTFASHFI